MFCCFTKMLYFTDFQYNIVNDVFLKLQYFHVISLFLTTVSNLEANALQILCPILKEAMIHRIVLIKLSLPFSIDLTDNVTGV